MPRSAARAAAPLLRAPPGTSAPRTSSTCSTARGSRRGSISTSSSPSPSGSRAYSSDSWKDRSTARGRSPRSRAERRRIGMAYRLGVDVGGTFTDLLLVHDESGAMYRVKTPSTPADPSEGVLVGVRRICDESSVAPGDLAYVQ